MLILLNNQQYHFWILDMSMPDLKFIEPSFNIHYDLEQQDKNEWLFHIDAGVLFPEKGEFDSRSTFKALCDEDSIFTMDLLLPALKKSVQYSRTRLRQELRTYEVDCPPVARLTKDKWQGLAERMIKSYRERGRVSDEDAGINEPVMTLHLDGEASFVIFLTLHIILNLISRSHTFKTEENLRLFIQYVPEPLWKRIYFKWNGNSERPRYMTGKELVMLYFCIDCAVQCMAGKTWKKLKKAIYDLDRDMRHLDAETERKKFLTLAEDFKEKIKLNLPSVGFKMANFNKAVSWDEQITAF
ncbi:MAG: hypothetical protein ABI855_14975 [Bacteroidota bacterium]